MTAIYVERHGPAIRALWERFAVACGVEEIARCYRVGVPVTGERVWELLIENDGAGWFSLVPDPFGASVTSRSGIFPQHRGRGLWRPMLEQIRLEAFSDPAIRAVRALVLLSNVDNAQRMIGLTQRLPWYAFDGLSVHPPAYHIITTRAAWDARGLP